MVTSDGSSYRCTIRGRAPHHVAGRAGNGIPLPSPEKGLVCADIPRASERKTTLPHPHKQRSQTEFLSGTCTSSANAPNFWAGYTFSDAGTAPSNAPRKDGHAPSIARTIFDGPSPPPASQPARHYQPRRFLSAAPSLTPAKVLLSILVACLLRDSSTDTNAEDVCDDTPNVGCPGFVCNCNAHRTPHTTYMCTGCAVPRLRPPSKQRSSDLS